MNSLLLKMARAECRPAHARATRAPRRLLLGRRGRAVGQPVSPNDLDLGLWPRLAHNPFSELIDHVQDKRVVQQRQRFSGVVVTAQLGDVIEGSGQSSTSNKGLRRCVPRPGRACVV